MPLTSAGVLADHVVPAHLADLQQHQTLLLVDLAQHRQRVVVGDEVTFGVAGPEIRRRQQAGLGNRGGETRHRDAAHLHPAADDLLRDLLFAADEDALELRGPFHPVVDLGDDLLDEAEQRRARLGRRNDLPVLLRERSPVSGGKHRDACQQ
jgi:hypothetical protein